MKACKADIRCLVRLKSRGDFVRAAKRGQKWVARGLVVQAYYNNGEGAIRVGFTVTKRTNPSAVIRNRIKRRLRAVAADVLPVYGISDADYVLIGRSLAVSRSYDDLKQDLCWCLKNLSFKKDTGPFVVQSEGS